MIVGGAGCDALASAELYDPLTNTFAPPTETAVMNHARAGATATLITSGPASCKVLIAGGAPEALDTMNRRATLSRRQTRPPI
ncbi:MAG: Kelch repeat-containing protein [Candidatus Binataceae bacterium]